MTVAIEQNRVIAIANSGALVEGTKLHVIDTADLCPGTLLKVHPHFPLRRDDFWSAQVISLEDTGAIALIEVEGEVLRLSRGTIVNAGGPGDIGGRHWVVQSVGCQ